MMDSTWDTFNALPVINQATIDPLTTKGVPGLALGSAGDTGDVLRLIRGKCADDGWFELADTGETHIAIMTYDEFEEPIDIACWHPKSGTVATVFGKAWALGVEQINNPGNFAFDHGLFVHRSVLEWLRWSRDGLFIIRHEAAFDALRNVPGLIAENRHHGQELRRLLAPPHLPKILIRKPVLEAA